jgi:hypothetical protein
MAGISPKGGTNTPGNTELAAETSINIAGINTIYVWFEDTTVTPTCTREKFLLSLFLFLHYQNIQTSLAALLTRYQLKWRCLLFKSK